MPDRPCIAIVMAKAFSRAKTRLTGLSGEARQQLCAAMLLDTITVVAGLADRIIVASDEPKLGRVLEQLPTTVEHAADHGGGLNAVIREVDASIGRARSGIAPLRIAMVADIPALRSDDFAAIVAAMQGNRSSFVADAQGTGTTMLGTTGQLDPRFGKDSAAQHRASGAVPLTGSWPGARQDVDSLDDLVSCIGLGVGANTAALLSEIPAEWSGHTAGARIARSEPLR